ncbi:MAG: alpha/beta hydrolase [Candidatus Accumulibacter phosphatis]|uniref:alpha/beta hydrolase n=1 Tax=Candidatus Accumulibacter phosphatis TaxID=327160 RepID=UPI001A412C62|nr:alpha/beta hydrolase [Candidatus Accumulibacter phosphatis]
MPNIADLLTLLEAAVRAGDRARALDLARQIQQALVRASHDHAAIERQVRELLARLDQPAPTPSAKLTPADIFGTERGLEDAGPAAGTVYPVWFGTNRKPDGHGGFGSERHPRTTHGRAEVLIPKGHRFGETGSSFWKKLLRFDLRDDRLRLQRLTTQERADWFGEIRQAMRDAKESGDTPQALFFLHGFNVSFEEAAIRAAQIGFDLKVPGATAFFSWPSRGSVTAYPADEASIEASERAITDFLVDFASHCGAEKVHVIAHSMGNRGLLRALQRIAANAETRGRVKFGQVFLAAPDVDRDLFLDLAGLYPPHSERTTLYASDGDLPVHLSAKLHDAPRAGYFAPYTVAPGVDTIAVPHFDLDLLGHSYFAEAAALLHDIYSLMRLDAAPGRRQRMTPAVAGDAHFWQLGK